MFYQLSQYFFPKYFANKVQLKRVKFTVLFSLEMNDYFINYVITILIFVIV